MTCKRIAKLLSEQQDRELSFPRRLVIHLHLFLCVFCRRLVRHLEVLRRVSQAVGEVSILDEMGGLDAALSPDAKHRLRKIVAQKSR